MNVDPEVRFVLVVEKEVSLKEEAQLLLKLNRLGRKGSLPDFVQFGLHE